MVKCVNSQYFWLYSTLASSVTTDKWDFTNLTDIFSSHTIHHEDMH